MMNWHLFTISVSTILFTSCNAVGDDYITLDGQAQGTTFHIVYENKGVGDLTTSVDSLFRLIDLSMSLWVKESVINRLNRNEENILPDEHFIKVFHQAQKISEATNGALDITIGPLVNAWKIGENDKIKLPDTTTIDSILVYTGFEKVSLKNGNVYKQDSRIQLDFNAIAQGYTVDHLCAFLMEKGIENYLVEIGGEVRAQGVNPRAKVWQIGIDRPVDTPADERALQTSLPLHNKSLATSGSYRKYRELNGQKFSHVLNPKTGYPADQTLLSVSVIADDCMTADGYATAFLVMGLEEAMAFAIKKSIPIYCIYADQNGEFVVKATPDFPN